MNPGRQVFGTCWGSISSEWFILSVLLVPKSEEPNIGTWIAEMLQRTGSGQLRDPHFVKLPFTYKGAVTEVLAQRPVKGFVICSNKKNMRRYRNVCAGRMGVKDWFHCWITRVALERASHFVLHRSVQKCGAPKRMRLISANAADFRIGQIGAFFPSKVIDGRRKSKFPVIVLRNLHREDGC